MAAKDAIIFDGLPFGMRAGRMSAVLRGRCSWTPTAPARRPRPAIAADREVTIEMADVIPGYLRIGGPAR